MDKKAIKEKIESEIKKIEEKLIYYRDMSSPISPDNSIGRVSRMDAINNKGVADYALHQAEERLSRLKAVYSQVDDESFGICQKCSSAIRIERLMYMPESAFCVKCQK